MCQYLSDHADSTRDKGSILWLQSTVHTNSRVEYDITKRDQSHGVYTCLKKP